MTDILLDDYNGGANRYFVNDSPDEIDVRVTAAFDNFPVEAQYEIYADPEDTVRLELDFGLGYFVGIGSGYVYIDILGGAGPGRIEVFGTTDIDITNVCFTRGAMVATPGGLKLIEDLREGDLVLTRDHGAQPIRWIGSTMLTSEALVQFPERRPITIAAGTFGAHGETTVSPAHRVLVDGWRAEALFGQSEVLASAGSLVNDTTIRRVDVAEVEYFHMMFDAHELVMVDGMWSESFHPAALETTLSAATRDEVLELFPELETAVEIPVARPALGASDVAVLF